jgi:hypothetical protein
VVIGYGAIRTEAIPAGLRLLARAFREAGRGGVSHVQQS